VGVGAGVAAGEVFPVVHITFNALIGVAGFAVGNVIGT